MNLFKKYIDFYLLGAIDCITIRPIVFWQSDYFILSRFPCVIIIYTDACYRPHNERLDERDVDSLDAEESQGGYPSMTSSQQTAATDPESHLVRTDADDEELVIEDYDDD